jgi:light-regulated signal transduction histidine kinase (bacteriophytochrome)
LRREHAELQRELATTNQDLESLSYAVSHDLRAPLRTIDSFARILQDDCAEHLDDECRRVIGVIRSASQELDQFIVGLRELSRAGKQLLDVDRIDMTGLAKTAAAEMTSQYQGPAAIIEIADLPAVSADATVMRQVWCSLIGNALKFSAKRAQPHVRIRGRIEGGEAIYQVDDNGAGFDMRYADSLFGVFQRLHRAEEFTGIGIGLAIVRRCLARHGGRIWARGTPDAGACFLFALPLAVAS